MDVISWGSWIIFLQPWYYSIAGYISPAYWHCGWIVCRVVFFPSWRIAQLQDSPLKRLRVPTSLTFAHQAHMMDDLVSYVAVGWFLLYEQSRQFNEIQIRRMFLQSIYIPTTVPAYVCIYIYGFQVTNTRRNDYMSIPTLIHTVYHSTFFLGTE